MLMERSGVLLSNALAAAQQERATHVHVRCKNFGCQMLFDPDGLSAYKPVGLLFKRSRFRPESC